MAGFLAMMAFVVLAGTWLIRISLRLPVMDIRELCGYGIVVISLIFLYGIMIAKVGIALIHEVLEEQRSRAEELRFRAKQRYEMSPEEILAEGGLPEENSSAAAGEGGTQA